MALEVKLPYEYGQAAYFFELERRDQLSSREHSAYILISLIIGGLSSIISNIDSNSLAHSGAIVITTALSAIVLLSAAKVLIENRFRTKKYKHAETVETLNALCVEGFHNGADRIEISNSILNHLMEATDHNAGLNDTRAERLHGVDFQLTLAIGIGIVAFIISRIASF